jgi:hypothetical protein
MAVGGSRHGPDRPGTTAPTRRRATMTVDRTVTDEQLNKIDELEAKGDAS